MSNDLQAVPARTDFYTVVHKGLRKRLFDTVVLAGTTNYADPTDRAKLAATVAEVVTLLREHAQHEDELLHPIIAEVLPEVASTLTSEHEEHNRALDEVERAFEVAIAERTGAAGHLAYRVLARFTAHFLAHIEEEEAGQAQVWELAGEARLAAGMTAFKRSRTLDQNLAGWANMLPAMNPAERAAMFRSLRVGAPEAVFAAASRLAERVLDRLEEDSTASVTTAFEEGHGRARPDLTAALLVQAARPRRRRRSITRSSRRGLSRRGRVHA
jgi:hemerythrin HHE cation binding domain-containing protein